MINPEAAPVGHQGCQPGLGHRADWIMAHFGLGYRNAVDHVDVVNRGPALGRK